MLTYLPPSQPLRILVCVPSGDTWQSRMGASLSTMISFSTMHARGEVALMGAEGSMIARSRNNCARVAMEKNFDYVLQIDSDMTFPPETLLRLLSHDKDIVGALYNKRMPPYETLGKLDPIPGKKPEDARNGGLWPAILLPGGMMLVKTEVYRKMDWPWYFESYQRSGDPIKQWRQALSDHSCVVPSADALDEVIANCPKFVDWMKLNAHWQKAENSENEMCGEDYGFCRKALRAGFKIWCDLDLSFKMTHLGRQSVSCDPHGAIPPEAIKPQVAAD